MSILVIDRQTYTMASLVCTALVVLIPIFVGLDAKPATFEDVADTVSTGRLYAMGENGVLRSLLRDDVQSMNNDEGHPIRLSLDDGSDPLDMHLQLGSVWDSDSVLDVIRGESTFKVPHTADINCYLHGRVHSHDGAVTINRCGRMTGHIHVPGHHYELKEVPQPVGGDGQSHAHFTVTRRKADEYVISKDDMDMLQDRSKREIFEPVDVEDDNSTSREKREIRRLTIELAVFADSNYVNHLVDNYDLNDYDAIKGWFVNKWNLVSGALSDPEKVGAIITIKLKKVQLWYDNPQNYPADDVLTAPRLDWFCENTPAVNRYDTNMLYTKDTSGHAFGVAFVKGVCVKDYNCMLAKSPTESATVEIHQLGHSLGFHHDSAYPDCDGMTGFMGWDMNYVYLPCYKKELTELVRSSAYQCLYQETVPDDDN